MELDLRRVFRFEITRLRLAAQRLQLVDLQLREIRYRLELRAAALAEEADGGPPMHDRLSVVSDGPISGATLRAAQAQATADLARRAALGEVLRHAGSLHLVVAMAVCRWIDAISTSLSSPSALRTRQEALIESHIAAGRVVHRMLVALRSHAGLRSGCGQAVCALVVGELVPPELTDVVQEQLEEGWERARRACGGANNDAQYAISQALREGAALVERMATKAEQVTQGLLEEEAVVELQVKQRLLPK